MVFYQQQIDKELMPREQAIQEFDRWATIIEGQQLNEQRNIENRQKEFELELDTDVARVNRDINIENVRTDRNDQALETPVNGMKVRTTDDPEPTVNLSQSTPTPEAD